MYECNNCGSDVSDRYWHVFAVEGELHGCLHCERKSGQHAPRDRDTRTDRDRVTG